MAPQNLPSEKPVPKGYWIGRVDIADEEKYKSYIEAIDCWKSPEYQRALQLRKPVSTIDLTIIEGYDGPQPA